MVALGGAIAAVGGALSVAPLTWLGAAVLIFGVLMLFAQRERLSRGNGTE